MAQQGAGPVGAPQAGAAPGPARPEAAEPSGLQSDPAHRRRLRWRARRGLLENDIVLQRYLDRYEHGMSDAEVAGLDALLDLSDNQLLDLILGRSELPAEASADAARVLSELRRA